MNNSDAVSNGKEIEGGEPSSYFEEESEENERTPTRNKRPRTMRRAGRHFQHMRNNQRSRRGCCKR